MSKGLDCAVSVANRAADIKAAGFDFVVRYYFPQSNWRQELTQAEAEACKDNGLWVVSVYEANPTAPGYFTDTQGFRDATVAYSHAKNFQPRGTTIYFAYDTDVNPDVAEVYGKAVWQMFENHFQDYFEPAAYASGAVITRLKQKGYIKKGWLAQSRGWSGYALADGHEEMQQGRETTMFGLDVDTDISAGDAGGWMLPG